MKNLFYLLVLLCLLCSGKICSQTNSDVTLIGEWKLMQVKMVNGAKEETRKEKELLYLNSDGTYSLKNKRGEISGTWSKNDSILTFNSPTVLNTKEKFSYQNIIISITGKELILNSKDGFANFYSSYKRQK